MFVKICGITSQGDALLSVAFGADALGFVFAPSPRQVLPVHVEPIVSQLPKEVLTFGVFRNELKERILEIVDKLGLSGAQLHGDETPEDVEWLAERIPYVIKAFPAGKGRFNQIDRYRCWAVMVDSPNPGSGRVFDWALVDGIDPDRRLIVAGGLSAENVEQAIGALRPFGVDVSSGVEASPGKKDPAKLRHFIERARRACAGAREEIVSEKPELFDIEKGQR